MHSTGSFILTVIERARSYLDDADLEAKYNDDFMIRNVIAPATQDVMGRVGLMQRDPVLLRLDIDLVINQEFYSLPPCIRSIVRLAKTDEYGAVVWEEIPQSEFHWCGPGWAIEGNILSIRPAPGAAETLTLWYVSNGDHLFHYGSGASAATGGAVAALGTTVFTLAQTVATGIKDRRVNAYAGSILRILGDATVWQERVISASNPTDGTHGQVTVRIPFDPSLAGQSSLRYEIAPPMNHSLWEAIACAAAHKMSAYKGTSAARRDAILMEYKKAMKTVKDLAVQKQGRTGQFLDKNTVDNPNLEEGAVGSVWG